MELRKPFGVPRILEGLLQATRSKFPQSGDCSVKDGRVRYYAAGRYQLLEVEEMLCLDATCCVPKEDQRAIQTVQAMPIPKHLEILNAAVNGTTRDPGRGVADQQDEPVLVNQEAALNPCPMGSPGG